MSGHPLVNGSTVFSNKHSRDLELLCCAICQEKYKVPKILPCLHSFCQQCLCDEIPSQSLSVTCPLCRQQSILPLEGVTALQNNVFINQLLINRIASSVTCSACGPYSQPKPKTPDSTPSICTICRQNRINMDTSNNNNNNNNTGATQDNGTDDTHSTTHQHQGQHVTNGYTHRNGVVEDADQRENTAVVPHKTVSFVDDRPALTSTGVKGDGTSASGNVSGNFHDTNGAVSTQEANGTLGTIVCPNHAGSELKYYCSHCDTAVCEACTQVEHIGHITVALSEAVIEHKVSLTSLVARVRHMRPEVLKAVETVETTCEKLQANKAEAEDKIVAAFQELMALLESRKQTVLAELDRVSTCKENVLRDQSKALHQHLSHMASACELTEESLARGNNTDVVLVKKEMAGKLSDLLTNGPDYQPDSNDLALFDETGIQQVKDAVQNAGCIYENMGVPQCSSAGGEGLNGCIAGKASTITITTRDRNGDVVKCGKAPLVAYISSDQTEEKLTPHIIDLHNGTYELTFTLSFPGVYYLSVSLFGHHTRGSPYKIRVFDASETAVGGSARVPRTMAVKPKGVKRTSSSRSQGSGNRRTNRIEDDLIMKVGVKGRNKGEFFNPQGLCFHNDRVFVADSNNQNVQVFAPSGECRLRFGAPGRAPGKMQRPTGVAVTNNGNFLVADYDNRWVSVFNEEGKYLSRIGTSKLLGPKGIAVDRDGRIIIVDNKSSCIFIFQANGRLLSKFGSRGNSESHFAGPHYVAITPGNDIAVSDFHNHCVKVFDSDGRFKFAFGSNGEGNGQFNAPTGIAVDERGNILVADWGNSRVQIFDSSGSFLSFINTGNEPLYGPQGLAVTTQGVAVVSDSGNHCIKYYRYLQ